MDSNKTIIYAESAFKNCTMNGRMESKENMLYTIDSKEHASVLYNMDLHEMIEFSDELYVRRVPGGWIYHTLLRDLRDRGIVHFVTSVFVEYDNRFQNH